MKKFKAYSLLYIDKQVTRKNINLAGSTKDSIDIYIRCGIMLSKSCDWHDVQYGIITNEPEFLEHRIAQLGARVDVVGINFSLQVPKGVAFYSAHFKVDVLKEIGTGRLGECVALIDIDTVIVAPLPTPSDICSLAGFHIYDIQNIEAATYGEATLQKTIGHFLEVPEGLSAWFGGEFILGQAKYFSMLSDEIERMWENIRKT